MIVIDNESFQEDDLLATFESGKRVLSCSPRAGASVMFSWPCSKVAVSGGLRRTGECPPTPAFVLSNMLLLQLGFAAMVALLSMS